MKTIGLLGGMSWESTLGYYRAINQGVNKKLGGLHSAKVAMVSIDFDPLEKLQKQGEWARAGEELAGAAQKVQAAGADFLVICTNTMHKVAAEIARSIDIPVLHIADATAEAVVKQGLKTVGLLGTRFTMEDTFYKGRLQEKYHINVLVPSESDMTIIHNVIYQELCLGKVESNSKEEYLRIIGGLSNQGAEAVILGCTEIGMLISQSDTNIRLFDTTTIHAEKAVEFAMLGEDV